MAPEMLASLSDAYIIADKAYDADAVIAPLQARRCTIVIPARKHRLVPREIDKQLYKERHLVENFFRLIKRPRRVCTRYEKLACTFLSFVTIASILVLLR
jgi:transposase